MVVKVCCTSRITGSGVVKCRSWILPGPSPRQRFRLLALVDLHEDHTRILLPSYSFLSTTLSTGSFITIPSSRLLSSSYSDP